MAHTESLWPRLADLPLVVESCEYERLHAVLAHEFERVTTHLRLAGGGVEGVGEDVSVHVEDGTSLHEARPALPLAGVWTLAGDQPDSIHAALKRDDTRQTALGHELLCVRAAAAAASRAA